VLTREDVVPGVVGRKPPHLTDPEERKKAVELKKLHVDIGAKDGDEARSLVRPGDQVVIAAEPLDLPNGRVASRALDNRLGVFVAIEVARRVKQAGGGGGPVAGVAAVQEEIGAHGARVMAYGLEPDLAVVVDVTHASDAPGVDPGELGEHGLGSGPVITRGAVVNRAVNDLLDEVAAAEGIECSTEASGRSTGTDADTVHLSRTGVPTAVVSIPLRYMHSPVEMVDLADVEATIKLLTALALRLEADTSLARW
jgi:putative aminopeptidase FrvX